MNTRQIEVVLGGLFHDIGNILYTHNVGISNCEEGYRFIKDAGIDNESILEQLKFQYYNSLNEAQANNNYNEIIKFVEENLEKTFEFYFEHISNNWQEEIENLKK